jgi:chromosome segregation ATPase
LKRIFKELNKISENPTIPDDPNEVFNQILTSINNINSLYLNESNKNQELTKDNSLLKHKILDLEARLTVCKNELESTKDCNDRFSQERIELTTANTTLSTALVKMKNSLITSDEERKKLKEENNSLKSQLQNQPQ